MDGYAREVAGSGVDGNINSVP